MGGGEKRIKAATLIVLFPLALSLFSAHIIYFTLLFPAARFVIIFLRESDTAKIRAAEFSVNEFSLVYMLQLNLHKH